MKIILALALCFTINAIAGGESAGTSGGGRAIVCFDNRSIVDSILDPKNPRQGIVTNDSISHVRSVETLDYYYAKAVNGTDGLISFEPSIEKPNALIEAVANRLDGLAQIEAWAIKRNSPTAENNQIVPLPNGLFQIDDAAEAFVPDDNCIITTVARQSRNGTALSFEFDKRLTDRMNPVSLNFLYLHESVYAVARENGFTDSKLTRNFLAIVTGNKPITYQTMKNYQKLFKAQYDSYPTRERPDTFTLAADSLIANLTMSSNSELLQGFIEIRNLNYEKLLEGISDAAIREQLLKSRQEIFNGDESWYLNTVRIASNLLIAKILPAVSLELEVMGEEIKKKVELVKKIDGEIEQTSRLQIKKLKAQKLQSNQLRAEVEYLSGRYKVLDAFHSQLPHPISYCHVELPTADPREKFCKIVRSDSRFLSELAWNQDFSARIDFETSVIDQFNEKLPELRLAFIEERQESLVKTFGKNFSAVIIEFISNVEPRVDTYGLNHIYVSGFSDYWLETFFYIE